MEGIGLALLYPAHERSVCAPGHHGYPRASDAAKNRALTGEVARGAGHRSELLAERPRLTPE